MSSSEGPSSSPDRREREKVKDGRPRQFDSKAKALCWASADIVPGRHPERWRKDIAGNIVCKRFFNCSGCLCYEYDHVIPFSKDRELDLFEMAVYGDVIRPGKECRCRTVAEMLGKYKAKDSRPACELPKS
ncbi:OLC1v1012397C2 [Oldenlandia corymbosa var. corymbosa]|uniref:OLC1v1012397C2 n=1 Tax=Oldenlandia corymbosa var. corymbosa TaxID=529605 RepID=A0AAV1DVY5_OLDCO|nr:OLC1v1012397C2 [Oldenlandia corymbosa var. corymbosa]